MLNDVIIDYGNLGDNVIFGLKLGSDIRIQLPQYADSACDLIVWNSWVHIVQK